MWHIIQHLFNEVNELLGSSLFLGVSFLLKVCRHAQNYMKCGKRVSFWLLRRHSFQKVRESEGGLGNR